MSKITVQIPAIPATDYPILIQEKLLQQPHRWLPSFENIVIITDHRIKRLYGQALAQSLKKAGRRLLLLSFAAGEKSKSQQTKQRLEEKMLQNGFDRNTLCLALGGGVVGDVAGFVAATYLRGIPIIQIPTSLLAMVDSSVGGKTAIDTPYGKNMIGVFWQPMAVIADTGCLQSLPRKQLIAGLIEAIKMFLTHDQNSFEWIQKQWNRCLSDDKKALQSAIERAVKIKAAVVACDVREQSGQRALLNFGHTIGHALEKITDYKILHGYAVAYGILMETKISELLGVISVADYNIIANLFQKLGIFAHDFKKYSVDDIILATKHDKKVRSGKTYYVLLKNIGAAFVSEQNYVHHVPDTIVKQAFKTMIGINNARQ